MELTIIKGGTALPERSVSPLAIVVGGPERPILPAEEFAQVVRDFVKRHEEYNANLDE